MLLSFLLNVFSISVCHCLKSVIYKKVCVFLCVCVCVWCKTSLKLRIWFLQKAFQQVVKKPPNQKFKRTLAIHQKFNPFRRVVKKTNPVGPNAVETEPFVMWTYLKIYMYYNTIPEHQAIQIYVFYFHNT